MSAAHEVYLGIDALIEADELLRTQTGARYHAGVVPPSTSLPYIVADSSTENKRNTFNRAGRLHTRAIHIYSRTEDAGLVIYGHLCRILKEPLEMANHEWRWADVSLISTFADSPTVVHTVARYECATKAKA